jgi:GT2 family glycosyltransferase
LPERPGWRSTPRLRASGKFLFEADGEGKVEIRGVTYGPFAPDEHGCEYGTPARVRADFEAMRRHDFNALRLYTPPPIWLLDAAVEAGLHVMVGLPWEQHVAFLDGRRRRRGIVDRVCRMVRGLAGHPAVFCYAVGNEIPSPMVRWYGPRPVEKWIARLCDVTRQLDPDALVTYVNYPSTEYLELPFLDLAAFNVYLESPATQQRYLARLQNLAGDRPLLMAEMGLDSLRAGEAKQAESVARQVSVARSAGCAGSFVFAWTDEWHRGGHDILDWQFGLTDRSRRPKISLPATRRAFAGPPIAPEIRRPRMSVVICTYNGARTLEETLRAVSRLDYPDFEAIVVDDGSTDRSWEIAAKFDVRLIRIPNGGLSNARNVGLHAATGEIVVYLDDDAYPDVDWLTHLAAAFADGAHAGIGGPNIPPAADGAIADCVAHSPGGPTHVLVSDGEAEHIPGCNMAFLREKLLVIGGFDPQFRIAGDDVDVCWRIQEKGWTLGFCPAAVVWHHRRNSVRAYFKQQRNYGRAEAMLERRWPQKYNAMGHLTWSGRLYGKGYLHLLPIRRRRIYHGQWGTALFQSLYDVSPSLLSTLPLMPEWYLATAVLAAVGILAVVWVGLLPLAVLAVACFCASVGCAAAAGWHALIDQSNKGPWTRLKHRMLVIGLHIAQPMVRLFGRIDLGLTPWRLRGVRGFAFPRVVFRRLWSVRWCGIDERLAAVESALQADGAVTARGGEFDRWDLEVRGGMFGGARLTVTAEEHGSGTQLVRYRVWPRWSLAGAVVTAGASAAAAVPLVNPSVPAAIAAAVLGALLVIGPIREPCAALATLMRRLPEGREQSRDA